MKQFTSKTALLLAALALASMGSVFSGRAIAQQKTVEQKQTGPAQITVDTRNTTVAYIEGNHLVVRLADGSLEAIRIPAGERFNIDGEKLALNELKPGMTLTEETYSTARPVVVKTVEIADGTVWHAAGKRLIIRTKDGNLADYQVPEWATVTINGEEMPLHQMRRGQQITATIITEEPMTVVEREARSHGHHPMTEPKKSATEMKPLPKEAPVTAMPEVTKAAPPTELQPAVGKEEKLPETASQLPLIGLLGLLAVAMSLGVRAFRKAV
jgi:RNase P/RNase MRP subunit p29